MLKFEVNEVPEGLEQYYAPAGDGFRLKVEGAVSAVEFAAEKEKVKQFRATNTELLKKQSTLESMESILGEGSLKPAEVERRINDLATKRADTLVADMKKSHDERVKELEGGLSKKSAKLNELSLTSAVAAAAGTNGVKSTALEDVMFRAQKNFSVDEEGNLKYKEDKLDAEGKPYSVNAWLKDLAPQASHLFESNQGTGTPKNVQRTGPAVNNNHANDPLSDLMAGLATHTSATPRIN